MSKKSSKKSNIVNKELLKERALKPPPFDANVLISCKRRFVASAAFNGNILDRSLLGILGGMCTTTNSVLTSLCGTSKLKYIEMWAPPPSQGSSSTISIEWFGSNKKGEVISDTSINPMAPAHLKCSPPKGTLNSFWQANTGLVMFGLNIPSGTIIDIQLSGVLSDSFNLSNQQTIATGTNTNLYYSYLDAQVPSHVLVPQSNNITF